MAAFKKNVKNQILFILTKSGDGSFAKGAVESDVSIAVPQYVGVNAGSAVAGKGNLSLMPSLVQSGVFRATLKAAECNFDHAIYIFDGTSTAKQIIPVMFQTFNDVDLSGQISNVHSAVDQAYSRVVKAHSAATAGVTQGALIQSLASDTHSQAVQTNSRVALIQSLASDTHSAAAQANSRALVIQSLVSDTHSQAARTYSAVKSLTVALDASDVSQIADQVASAVGAGIGSQVWGNSAASQCLSAAKQAESHVLILQSLLSDLDSIFRSRVTSTVATASDLVSKVWGHADGVAVKSAAQQANARTLVIQSLVSDTHSQAVLGVSAAREGSARALVVQSLVSDTHSQTVLGVSAAREGSARALVVQSLVSDTNSQAILGVSAAREASARALVVQSLVSDTHSQTVLGVSAARQAGSRAIIIQSLVSDAQSAAVVAAALASHAVSAAVVAATALFTQGVATQSLISDTHSQAILGVSAARQANARTLLIQSLVSDLDSQVRASMPELAVGVPTATPTTNQAIMFLYMEQRNKVKTTSLTDAVYNNAGAVICSAVVSDDGTTFSRAQFA